MAKNKRGTQRAVKIAADSAFSADGKVRPEVAGVLQRAVQSQLPLVRANMVRMRRSKPYATPAELEISLEKQFINTVTGSGAAIGASAIIPGIGTLAGLGLSAGATVMFMEAAALYSLSVAELHNIHVTDPERASTAVMAIMLGEEGTSLMQSLAGRATSGSGTPLTTWGSMLGKNIPSSVTKMITARIQKMFVRKLIMHQGSAMIGRLVPFGVGAVIGGAGNLMMGRSVVKATKLAFGSPPVTFAGALESLPVKGPKQALGSRISGTAKSLTSKFSRGKGRRALEDGHDQH